MRTYMRIYVCTYVHMSRFRESIMPDTWVMGCGACVGPGLRVGLSGNLQMVLNPLFGIGALGLCRCNMLE